MICEFALGYSRFLVTWYLWCTSELDKIQGRPVSVCFCALSFPTLILRCFSVIRYDLFFACACLAHELQCSMKSRHNL